MKFETKQGFTLAEVLITLGVIGVVAALTIPLLQNHIEELQFESAVKKNYSVATSAFRKAAHENGGTLAGYSKEEGPSATRAEDLKDIVKPYLSVTKDCNVGNRSDCHPEGVTYKTYSKLDFPDEWSQPTDTLDPALILSDGAIWWFFASWDEMGQCKSNWIEGSNNSCGMLTIDTNGAKKPNRAGLDLYGFYISADGTPIPMGSSKDLFRDDTSKTVGYTERTKTLFGLAK